ncbi:MAG: flagellar biosynthesis protein FliQ [Oscillospiraceae bacterium]
MTESEVLEVFRSCMLIVLQLAGPALIASMVIGLIIAIFQAATQIHEQTLTFVPKLVGIAALLFIMASWIMAQMSDFVTAIFDKIARL